jgi:hypothetical protein
MKEPLKGMATNRGKEREFSVRTKSTVFEDNNGALHIDVVYHWWRYHSERKATEVVKIDTKIQQAGILTKALARPQPVRRTEKIIDGLVIYDVDVISTLSRTVTSPIATSVAGPVASHVATTVTGPVPFHVATPVTRVAALIATPVAGPVISSIVTAEIWLPVSVSCCDSCHCTGDIFYCHFCRWTGSISYCHS